MNTQPAPDEVDAYVDALLVEGLVDAVVTPFAPAAAAADGLAVVNDPSGASDIEVSAVDEQPVAAERAETSMPSPPAIEHVRPTTEVPPAPRPAAPVFNADAFAPPPPAPTRAMTLLQASNRWLRVVVGSGSYALELLCVQEVVRVAPIVAMRGANPAVLGVMNLRGRIVPVFDLGLWLGTACVQPDERSRIVVVERDDELIGVLVTLVEDVVTLGQDRIEPPLAGSRPGPIVGVARVGATPTVLLDAGALFGDAGMKNGKRE